MPCHMTLGHMTTVSHDLPVQRDVWIEILLAAVGEQLSEAVDEGKQTALVGWARSSVCSVCVTPPPPQATMWWG